MGHFANHEIAFDVPDDWEDRSTTSFFFAEAATNITLTRADAGAGIPLAAYEAALAQQLGAICPELELLERKPVRVASAEGVQLTFEWIHPGARFRNVITCLLADGVLWSLTASTPTSALQSTAHVIERAMRSFRLVEVAR